MKKIVSHFTRSGRSEEEKMLPYYASVLLLKNRLLRADLNQVVDSDFRFSNPDGQSHSISYCVWSWRKKTWDKKQEKEKMSKQEKNIGNIIGSRPKYRFPWGKALIKKFESSKISFGTSISESPTFSKISCC